MFSSPSYSAKAYAKVGIETDVLSANPHKLILMLFDGALLAISSAKLHMEQKHIPEKGQAISQAINIINDGLKASLDLNAGGDLAERLNALYDYMCTRLLYANLQNSIAALDEVSRLLGEIKGAWLEIADNPAVHSKNQVAA